MGGESGNMVRWELAALAELDLLEEGEILCDVQEVMADESLGGLGVLVVTDLRLLFLRTGITRRRTQVEAVPLGEIEGVRASASSFPWPFARNRGALVISRESGPGQQKELKFERIRGGQARAEELARTILYHRNLLQSTPGGPETRSSDEAYTKPQISASEPAPKMSIGRGVASYVKAHGGRLYVWVTPLAGSNG